MKNVSGPVITHILEQPKRDTRLTADIVAIVGENDYWLEVKVLDLRPYGDQYAAQVTPILIEQNSHRYTPDEARQLAAHLIAAADYADKYDLPFSDPNEVTG